MLHAADALCMAECGLHDGRVYQISSSQQVHADSNLQQLHPTACAQITLCPFETNLRALSMRLATPRRLGVHVTALCAVGAEVEAAAALEARASCMTMNNCCGVQLRGLQSNRAPHPLQLLFQIWPCFAAYLACT